MFRVHSGGCILMVEGINQRINQDNETPYNWIEVLTIPNIFEEFNITKDQLKKELEELMFIQGEANVLFNDAISLSKEVKLNEISYQGLIDLYDECEGSTYEEKARRWFKTKMALYEEKKDQFLIKESLIKKLMMLKSIPQNHDLIEKLVDYIKLNKAAIFGVPYWSCYLTLRYF